MDIVDAQDQWQVVTRSRYEGGEWSEWKPLPRTSDAPYLRRQDAQAIATRNTTTGFTYSRWETEAKVQHRRAWFSEWEDS